MIGGESLLLELTTWPSKSWELSMCGSRDPFFALLAGRTRPPENRQPIKITIPSDLRFHSQALSVNVGSSCELPVAKIRRPWRAKLFRASATTLKFRIPSSSLARRQRECELENFNFNLSGSDPVVANRAGVILPYEIFLSTKKCFNKRKTL